jgi:tetratricopeptide (TPR) repeat protein
MRRESGSRTHAGFSAPRAAVIGTIILLAVHACGVSPARAAKMYFGKQDYLHPIQDVAIKGQNGEALYLGYKHSSQSFILPYSVSDDGYILGVKGESDRYYALDKARIARFQADGLLPSPLPPSELSVLDRVMGHSLWGLLVVMAAIFGFNVIRKKRWQERRRLADPHFKNAAALGEKGDLDGAIVEYSKAIDIAPDFESALVNRGATYERKGEFDRAIADFTKAIRIGPKSVTVIGLVNRGIAYQKKGELDRAIKDHTRAIKQSGAAGAYFNRGNALAGKGDYARAIADYTKVIALDPRAAAAFQARGAAYAKQGDASLAQADYDAVSRLQAASPA